MHGHEKSDRPVVPASPPNKAGEPAAEAGEGSGLGEENAAGATRPGHRAGLSVPSALDRVRRVATRDKRARFTALLHDVDVDRLRAAYWAFRPGRSPHQALDALASRTGSGRRRRRERRKGHRSRRCSQTSTSTTSSISGPTSGGGMRTAMCSSCASPTDYIVGFEHRDDAERFLAELRGRLATVGLEPASEKTRLIEFGRFAAERRQKRGLGKPETFAFLGFTHICGKTRKGRFQLKRITEAKRLQAKLRELKTELMRRRHLPIPEQGRRLASVVRGHLASYAVPGNGRAVNAFRFVAVRHWHRALRRRSQRSSLNWKRMSRLGQRWLPPVRIMHPWPDARFHARIQARSPVS
jgi:hypothetical protein